LKLSPVVLREILEDIAEEVSRRLRTELVEKKQIVMESDAGGDKARAFDVEAEKIILSKILDRIGCTLVVSEELGCRSYCSEPDYIAIVDPVDGSFNFTADIPWCAVSIAVAYYKRDATMKDIVASVVRSVHTDTTYSYSNEEGCLVNGSSAKPLAPEEVIVGYFEHPRALRVLEKFWELYGKRTRVRSLGSAAMELTHLAAIGRALGFVDACSKLRNVDIAAAYSFSRACGCLMTDLRGRDLGVVPITRLVYKIPVVASRIKEIHELLLKACQETNLSDAPTYVTRP